MLLDERFLFGNHERRYYIYSKDILSSIKVSKWRRTRMP